LDYAKPEDVPALQARLELLAENENNLARSSIVKCRDEINIWKQDLNEYINNTNAFTDTIKVVGQLDTNGTLTNGSLKFFGVGPLGDFIPISLGIIPTSEDIHEEVEKGMCDLISSDNKQQIENNVVTSFTYNRLAARDYCNSWTSNATQACQTGSNTKQDKSKYNPNYTKYTCTDCANFVSQGLYAGGYPKTTTWKPYTSAWIYVPSLASYLTSNGWVTTTKGNCVAGYPFRLSSSQHFMMMTYNDGTTQRYSAHTSDVKNANWYNASAIFYKPQ